MKICLASQFIDLNVYFVMFGGLRSFLIILKPVDNLPKLVTFGDFNNFHQLAMLQSIRKLLTELSFDLFSSFEMHFFFNSSNKIRPLNSIGQFEPFFVSRAIRTPFISWATWVQTSGVGTDRYTLHRIVAKYEAANIRSVHGHAHRMELVNWMLMARLVPTTISTIINSCKDNMKIVTQ